MCAVLFFPVIQSVRSKSLRPLHRFVITKPLKPRKPYQNSEARSPDQITLVSQITECMLAMVIDFLTATRQTDALTWGEPFLLLEAGDDVCAIVGLDSECVVMLELIGPSPMIIWADNDWAALHGKSAGELRKAFAGLRKQQSTVDPFLLLTSQK